MRTNRRIASRWVQRLLSCAMVACLVACSEGEGTSTSSHSLPALTSATPSDGAVDVPRTAWITLNFATPIETNVAGAFQLSCDGLPQDVAVHLVDRFPYPQLSGAADAEEPHGADTVILNPTPELAVDAQCIVSWNGVGGVASIAFTTAPDGPMATVLYAPNDRTQQTPFPDDQYTQPDDLTATGLRLAVPAPQIGPLEDELLNAELITINRLDGFSPISYMVVELSDAPDPTSLPLTPAEALDPAATVGLFDIDSASPFFGRRIPFRLEPRTEQNVMGIVSHTLLIFPSIPLTPAGRYALVITRRALVDPTRPFGPSDAFRSLLGSSSARQQELSARAREVTDEVLRFLASEAEPSIPPEDVALAVRISIRSMSAARDDLQRIKEDILRMPPAEMAVEAVVPHGVDNIAAIVTGVWDAPEWRDGPFVARSSSGEPVRTGSKPVRFTLALPTAALTGPVPVTMYQHGTPGNAEREVPRVAGRGLAAAGFAVIGFTDNLNREVYPDAPNQQQASLLQLAATLGSLLSDGDAPDFYLETFAEHLAFIHALRAWHGLDVLPIGAADGIRELDLTGPLTYLGVSDGATNAVPVLAFAPEIVAAALVVGSGRQMESLIHFQGDGFLETLSSIYTHATATQIWTGLAFFQTLLDRQDPHNFAQWIYRDPVVVAGSARRASILLVEGVGDTLVPNNATNSLAWSLGPIPQVRPVQSPVPYLAPIDAPLAGNIADGTTAAMYQYVPAGIDGLDPSPGCEEQPEAHFCAQRSEAALHQRVMFFQSALQNAAPIIIDPLRQ